MLKNNFSEKKLEKASNKILKINNFFEKNQDLNLDFYRLLEKISEEEDFIVEYYFEKLFRSKIQSFQKAHLKSIYKKSINSSTFLFKIYLLELIITNFDSSLKLEIFQLFINYRGNKKTNKKSFELIKYFSKDKKEFLKFTKIILEDKTIEFNKRGVLLIIMNDFEFLKSQDKEIQMKFFHYLEEVIKIRKIANIKNLIKIFKHIIIDVYNFLNFFEEDLFLSPILTRNLEKFKPFFFQIKNYDEVFIYKKLFFDLNEGLWGCWENIYLKENKIIKNLFVSNILKNCLYILFLNEIKQNFLNDEELFFIQNFYLNFLEKFSENQCFDIYSVYYLILKNKFISRYIKKKII